MNEMYVCDVIANDCVLLDTGRPKHDSIEDCLIYDRISVWRL